MWCPSFKPDGVDKNIKQEKTIKVNLTLEGGKNLGKKKDRKKSSKTEESKVATS